MDNKEFSLVLENRTIRFAIAIVKISATLPNNSEGFVIRNQITKSGTSIGANYREANRSRSKADFYNKIKICESETSETVYWLEIIKDLKWIIPEDNDFIFTEANELLAIFTSIMIKLKNTLKS
ncbi:MAG: four helix bundle protein [Bacteroidales bacterium]